MLSEREFMTVLKGSQGYVFAAIKELIPKTENAQVPINTIAGHTHYHYDTVWMAIQQLEQLGMIAVDRQPGQPHRYKILKEAS
jgi:DNA-binding MarR family transcriptional regulator